MHLQVTLNAGLGEHGGIRLSSTSDTLCSITEQGDEYASESYFKNLERALTPLARFAVNHLCRGLQGITVRITGAGNGCQVQLIPSGPAASTLYTRMCSRVASSNPKDLPLKVALARDLGKPVDVSISTIGSSAVARLPK
jgi:hypothetical protein